MDAPADPIMAAVQKEERALAGGKQIASDSGAVGSSEPLEPSQPQAPDNVALGADISPEEVSSAQTTPATQRSCERADPPVVPTAAEGCVKERPPSRKKKLRKKDILKNIKDAQSELKAREQLGQVLTAEEQAFAKLRNLDNRRVAELREIWNANGSAGCSVADSPRGENQATPRTDVPKEQQERHEQLALANMLTHLTKVTAGVTETVVDETADYHGLTCKGFADSVKEVEPQLNAVYQEIIEKEGADNSAFAYLQSPYAKLALVLAGALAANTRSVKKTAS